VITHEAVVFSCVTLETLGEVAQEVVSRLSTCKVWLFRGEMGSGKTTLIKNIGKTSGVIDLMSSPTFSIINEYEGGRFEKVYHFDFFRIEKEIEAIDIGVEEYFYSGYPCFIEWPEKIPSLIPLQHGEVTIQVETNTKRTIAIAVHDGKKENRF
jgi:tRNA threonylcarbamoyladenosine biosynthesis protein TsaE